MTSCNKRLMLKPLTVFLLILSVFFFSPFSANAGAVPGEIFPLDEKPTLSDSHLVRLYDPFTYGKSKSTQAGSQDFKPISGEKVRVAIKKAKDIRSDTARIGSMRTYWGYVYFSILLEKDFVLSNLFTENLIHCFELAGFEVIPFGESEATPTTDKEAFKAVIDSEIISFWIVLNLDYPYLPGSVTFKVGLYEPKTNREIWSKMITGKAGSFSILRTRATYEKVINLAYVDAMRNLYKTISDETFSQLLQQK